MSNKPKQVCRDCIHYAACSSWHVGSLAGTDATHCANYERASVACGVYDQEEVHHNCTVQVLSNSVTGDVSIGWWQDTADEIRVT